MSKQLARLALIATAALVLTLYGKAAISTERLSSPAEVKHLSASPKSHNSPTVTAKATDGKGHSFVPYPDYQSQDCYHAVTYEASSLCSSWRQTVATEQATRAAEQANALALWALIFSAVGVLGLIGTLAQANRSLAESRRSADAAEKAIAETREVGEAQVRCYLSLDAAFVAFYPPDLKPRLAFTIKNVGQSPAFEITWAVEIQYSVLDQPDRRSERLATSMAPLTLAPGAGTELIPEVFDLALDLPEHEHLAGPDNMLGVTAKILMSAKDVFGKEVRTQALFGAAVGDINILTPMRFLGNGLPIA